MEIVEDHKVSFIIPTINEGRTIGKVIDGILENFKKCEIIVVDTNSTDDTRVIAASKGATVIEEPRKGYGRAYQTGLERSTGDIIVCLDGDGTYPTDIIRPLIEILLLDEVDFISCDRMKLRTSTSYTTLHYVGNMVLNITMRIFFKVNINDSQSGMWIFRSSLYKKMKNLGYGMSFSQNIKIEAIRNGKFIEIPIKYGMRISKPKLNTWKDGFRNLFELFIKRVSR